MFDTIAWGEKLPFSPEMEELGLNKNDWSFQTKDLDNGMDEYVVQEGKIFLIAYEKQEWVEGDKDSKDLFAKIGHIERTGRYLKPIDLTATICIYDYRHSVQDKWDCRIDYEAVFVKGALESVKLLKFEKTDNADRLQFEKEWQERYLREASLWYNKYIFDTTIWRKFIGWYLRRFFIASSQFLDKISSKIP